MHTNVVFKNGGRKMQKTGASNSENLLLSIRGIRKAFGLNQVLKGINLKLKEGEVLSLIKHLNMLGKQLKLVFG